MIYKRCTQCGKRIDIGMICTCKSKRYKEEDKYKYNTRERKFYSSIVWQNQRDKAIRRFSGLDIYSYYVYNRLEAGQTVHHIVPLKEDWNKRLELNNLIYLTEENHQQIHKQMREGEEKGREVISLLNELVRKFCQEFEENYKK